MRRVLIVTGSYAPTMIADMHRARQLAWILPEYGWDVEILAPDRSCQPPACNDEDSAELFASDTPTHYASPYLPWLFRALGIGSIGARAIVPMWRVGRDLLKQRRYDLVYISTAQFLLFLLGPAWHRQFGIPFVLDFHDPFYVEGRVGRPGLKNRINRLVSRWVESRAVTAASGLIAVSPSYLDVLRARYAAASPAWLAPGRRDVIPFAFLPWDLEEAARKMPVQSKDAPTTARIVYVGTGGAIMRRSFTLLCRALSHLRMHRAEVLNHVRIELYGTASALGGDTDRHLARVAAELGVADLISEDTRRVTYRQSLELLLSGAGSLILGVDDAGYMPSKLFTCASSGVPILASVHADSPAFGQFRTTPGLGHAVWFRGDDEMPLADAANTVGVFLQEVIDRRIFDRQASLKPYSARAMAQRHAELFEACLHPVTTA
jgi:glycosyltransferase involved in cell wall biosynthesis